LNNPNDESEWTEVINSKKNKKKTPHSSPTLSPTRSPNTSPDTQITEMLDIPDDALLDLSLERQPAHEHQNEVDAGKNEGNPRGISPAQSQTKTPAHNNETDNLSVFNPYTNEHITQRKPTNANTSKTPKNGTPSQHPDSTTNVTRTPTRTMTTTPTTNQPHHTIHQEDTPTTQTTTAAFIDLLDDASTQATNATNDTIRQQGTSAARSIHSQFQKTNAHIPINDGTLRITVRWKPHNYDEMTQEMDQLWIDQAVAMLKEILHHPRAPISLVPWQQDKVTNNSLTKITSLTSDIFTKIRSPKISNLDSYGMTIFGIRICATDPAFSTGTWLKDSTVQESLEKH
jgi:hypothetical protein